jgi:hypothetical protein
MGIYLTREQFLSKLRWTNAITAVFAFASIGFAVAAFVAGLSYTQKHPELEARTVVLTVALPLIIGYAVVNVIGLAIILRALGPTCPKCNGWFWRQSAQVVIASGRCGYCGGQVLKDV